MAPQFLGQDQKHRMSFYQYRQQGRSMVGQDALFHLEERPHLEWPVERCADRQNTSKDIGSKIEPGYWLAIKVTD